MVTSGIDLQLKLGTAIPSAAPAYVTEKLQSVQVTQNDNGPSVFQLHFHADRTDGLSQDFRLLSSSLLKPSTRVILKVTVNGHSTVLIDGFITHQELSHSSDFGASTLTVTGEDVSVLMDMVELSLEYPQLGDSMIAALVLAKYAVVGVVPTVVPTPSDLIPSLVTSVPQQNTTDRKHLQYLAGQYGFNFHVRPGPVELTNIAYWGPPIRVGTPKRALSVDMGSATNVHDLSFQFDALNPVQVYGMVQDTLTDMDLPVLTLTSTRLPHLASDPAFGLAKIFEKRQLYQDPRYGILQALVCAQATTDMSVDRVVVGTGSVDTVRYGAVLGATDLVDVRGVGQSYDGTYYVQSVTHTLSRGKYDQKFTITREGVGSTISTVPGG